MSSPPHLALRHWGRRWRSRRTSPVHTIPNINVTTATRTAIAPIAIWIVAGNPLIMTGVAMIGVAIMVGTTGAEIGTAIAVGCGIIITASGSVVVRPPRELGPA